MNVKEKLKKWIKKGKKFIKPLIPHPFTFWQMLKKIRERHPDKKQFKILVISAIAASIAIIPIMNTFPFLYSIVSGIGIGSLAVPDNIAQIIPAALIAIPLFILAEMSEAAALIFIIIGLLNIGFTYVNLVDEEILKERMQEV